MISCGCLDGYEITAVGEIKLLVCRTEKHCTCCDAVITVNKNHYRWNMFNREKRKFVRPVWLCEECGDMAQNLQKSGYCFSFDESLKKQWFKYLEEKGK